MGGLADRGRWEIVAAAVLWSLGGVFAKEIGLGGPALAFWRSLFGGLALLPFVGRGRWAWHRGLVPLGLAFAATMGLYLGSVKATTAANAIFLQCTATFWTIPMAALLLGEKPDRRSLAGIGLAMVGVALIVVRGRDGRPGEGVGIALGLASGIGYGAIVVGLRGLRQLDPTWLAATANLIGAGFLGVGIAATSGSIPMPVGADWGKTVAFGVIQLAIPYVLFARGLRTVGAAEASLLTLIEPAINPVWVAIRHGERPAGATIAGGLLLLLGVVTRYVPRPGDRRSVAVRAVGPGDAAGIERARGLLRAYAGEFGERIAGSLRVQGFEAEVDGLPGRYAGPGGAILLGYVGRRALGCVLVRDLGGGSAEMKRLYVAPEARGLGLGGRLIDAAVEHARDTGQARMVLDSIPEMVAAVALYRSRGFVAIPPYHPNTVGEAVYLGMDLGPRA